MFFCSLKCCSNFVWVIRKEKVKELLNFIKDWLTPVAAIAGACAWIPFFYSKFKKAKITIIPSPNISIRFSASGPIFAINLGFTSQYKDIIITHIIIKFKHLVDSEIKEFSWKSISQKYASSIVSGSVEMQNERTHDVLAIKLNQHNLEEKWILFQENSFSKTFEEKTISADKKLSHLMSKNKRIEFKDSQEFEDLCSATEQSFCWKSGEYKMTVILKTSEAEKFSLVNNEYKFSLRQSDIDYLSKNKPLIKEYYKNFCLENEEEKTNVKWFWHDTKLYKVPREKKSLFDKIIKSFRNKD